MKSKVYRKYVALLLGIAMVIAVLGGCSSSTSKPADATPGSATPAGPAATDAGTPASPGTQDEIKSSKDTLIIADKGTPGTLAPYKDTSYDRVRVTDNIYETLMFAESDGTLTPVLATEWEWKDNTHLVIKLREGVKFHNGNPFTADDVLFTVQYALASPTSNIFNVIDAANCKVIDDYTFELALVRPDAVILSYLGSPSMMSMLDKETCEADPTSIESKPVGTGPYKLKEWIVGDTVFLEAFEDYWGTKPYIKNVVFRKVSESTQRVIELETGGVDFIYDAPIASVEKLKEQNYTVIQQPGYLMSNLYFNAYEGMTMDNLELRKAIAYAIDYEGIVKGVGNGMGNVPTTFASRAAFGTSDINPAGTQWWPYDVEKAKECMAKAGYPDGLELDLLVNADHTFMYPSVEQLSNNLAEIGIKLNVQPMALGALISYVLDPNNDWDILVFGNGESSVVLQAARMDKNQCPFLGYKRDDLQEILDKMWVETDLGKLSELHRELGEYFNANIPLVPYHEGEDIFASVPELKNLKFYGSNLYVSKVYFE